MDELKRFVELEQADGKQPHRDGAPIPANARRAENRCMDLLRLVFGLSDIRPMLGDWCRLDFISLRQKACGEIKWLRSYSDSRVEQWSSLWIALNKWEALQNAADAGFKKVFFVYMTSDESLYLLDFMTIPHSRKFKKEYRELPSGSEIGVYVPMLMWTYIPTDALYEWEIHEQLIEQWTEHYTTPNISPEDIHSVGQYLWSIGAINEDEIDGVDT